MNENGQNEEQQQVHPAQVAQEFMRRTDMKGGEVEAYAQTFNWLQAFLAGELIATPKEAHLAMTQELNELRKLKAKQEGEDAGDLPVLEPIEQLADAEAKASREAIEAAGGETTETADPAVLDPVA